MTDKGLAAGIMLTNRDMPFCMHCSTAKQTSNRQGKLDNSKSALKDEIGAVLDLDLMINIRPQGTQARARDG